MNLNTNSKIPLYIIIAVIIFILIFVVILASIGSNEKKEVKVPYYKETKSKNILSKNSFEENNNKVLISSYVHSKVSDSFIVDIKTLNENESYIFGGPMQSSSVSVYKKNMLNDEYELTYTKVYYGNQGFVISSNLNIVNPSFYQIGKKINLESIRYNFIPASPNDEIRIAVNNIGYEDFKVYKCNFNDNILYKPIEKFPKSLSNFGLSEYDIEKQCKDKCKDLGLDLENIKKMNLSRSFGKKDKNIWSFNGVGDFIVFYVKNIYSFEIKDLYNNINIKEQGSKDLNNGKLIYFKITDPRLTIENLDENIPRKSFNDDIVNLMNAPVSFYKHFMYGKRKEKVDIWNRIQNKIFIYKI